MVDAATKGSSGSNGSSGAVLPGPGIGRVAAEGPVASAPSPVASQSAVGAGFSSSTNTSASTSVSTTPAWPSSDGVATGGAAEVTVEDFVMGRNGWARYVQCAPRLGPLSDRSCRLQVILGCCCMRAVAGSLMTMAICFSTTLPLG
jgi:hypothetical protein